MDIIKTAKEYVNKKDNPEKSALIWFITEIIQMIIIVIGAIILLWLYAPFSIIVKAGITALTMIIVYDIFKSFVYVRWILTKEQFK
jgi:hypothetical protein